MTGYGRGTASSEGWDIVVQVNSVNRKTLEVSFSMPREWQMLEPELATMVRSSVARGRVHVAIELRGVLASGLTWDDAVVDSVLERLAALAKSHGIGFQPTPELLLRVAEASCASGGKLAAEDAMALLKPALAEAMGAMVEMRATEGRALELDIRNRTEKIIQLVNTISGRSSEVVPTYRETLMQRLRQAGLELDLEDERVLKEVAIFADRIDVTEELTRVGSHLEQLAELAGNTDPVGRKAEFILQEIGREFNTIGSKANDLEIGRAVIEAKNELERIREQVQNIE